MQACPAHIDIRGYQALLQLGDVEGALALLTQQLPFPAITGRVCPHTCEEKCRRGEFENPVNINALEQALGDWMLKQDVPPPPVRHIDAVAVVGAGPAGLSCAWYLRQMGYPVTVFEEKSRAGGMLRYGIPAYRLPDAVLDRVIDIMKGSGIRFCCDTGIGKGKDLSLKDLRDRNYRAIFLAPGAGYANGINIPGSDAPQVILGLDFLASVRMGQTDSLRGSVVVIGGGDVAMDAAITAKRLGAEEVHVACLESRDRMPAHAHNIEDAVREDVIFHPTMGPAAILPCDQGVHITFHACTRLFNDEGRFAPELDGTHCLTLQAEHIIMAIGQHYDAQFFAGDIEHSSRGLIQVQALTFQTSDAEVFAAGDAVTGPSSVVSAMAGGREAARSIDRLLKGADLIGMRNVDPGTVPEERLPSGNILTLPRQERDLVPFTPEEPFAEFRKGLAPDQYFAEAIRCLTCGGTANIAFDDDCMTCFSCEVKCPSSAINVYPFKERIPRMVKTSDVK